MKISYFSSIWLCEHLDLFLIWFSILWSFLLRMLGAQMLILWRWSLLRILIVLKSKLNFAPILLVRILNLWFFRREHRLRGHLKIILDIGHLWSVYQIVLLRLTLIYKWWILRIRLIQNFTYQSFLWTLLGYNDLAIILFKFITCILAIRPVKSWFRILFM